MSGRLAAACFGALLACGLLPACSPGHGSTGTFNDGNRLADRYVLPADFSPATGGAVRATFLGTTMLVLDDGSTQLMFDAFLSRPDRSEVLGRRLESRAGKIDPVLEQVQATRVRAIFVAHSHYDHALDVAYIATKTGARVFGSPSTLNIARGGHVPEAQLVPDRPKARHEVGEFVVWIIPSRHSQSPFGLNLRGDIPKPLALPAPVRAFREGGTYDFLVLHRGRTILIKSSAHYLKGAYRCLHADVVFLATGGLGLHSNRFQDDFYRETVGSLQPQLVVPTHWDDFMQPLSGDLPLMRSGRRDLEALITRLDEHDVRWGFMQGLQSIRLFGGALPQVTRAGASVRPAPRPGCPAAGLRASRPATSMAVR